MKAKTKGPDLQKVQQAAQKAGGTGVQKLVAKAAGNSIEIHGEASSIAEKQGAFKRITDVVGDLGLVNKIEVKSGQTKAAAADLSRNPGALAQGERGVRTHVVKKGETLSHISQQYYGKASAYKKIFEANRNTLTDPDKIREGMKLTIPE